MFEVSERAGCPVSGHTLFRPQRLQPLECRDPVTDMAVRQDSQESSAIDYITA